MESSFWKCLDFLSRLAQLQKFACRFQFEQNELTKPTVLSDIAKIFHPLGWRSLVTIKLKHIMSEKSVQSDENVPLDHLRLFLEWSSKPHELRKDELNCFVFEGKRTNQVQLRL